MNKMKLNIKNLFAGAALSVALTGCVDLDVNPPAAIGPDSFWKTEKDAWYALNACYKSGTPGFAAYDDACVDNAFNHHGHESLGQTIQSAALNPSNNTGYGFSDIRRFNLFLENVDNCDMDADLKQRMKAEARFFRAYSYFNTNMNFGKAAIITEVLPYDAPYLPRNSVEEVRKFVMTELDSVIKILPPSYSGGYLYEKGRVTKWVAMAIKARAALYWGDYPTAEATAKEIMTKGGFDLYKLTSLDAKQQKEADQMDTYVDFAALGIDKDKFMKGMFSYEGIWQVEDASDNPECIWSCEQMASVDYADFSRYTALRPDQMNGGWCGLEPIQSLVDAYWNIDGKTKSVSLDPQERAVRYAEIQGDLDASGKTVSEFVQGDLEKIKNYAYTQEFRNRDARLYASILFPFKGWYETDMGTDFVYRWMHSNNDPKGGYVFRKMNPFTGIPKWGVYAATSDYPTLRYAEILLTFAEARFHNTGWDGEVEGALNQLRDRCGMPNVPTLSGDAALEFIRNERRIELAGEGHRFYDIRRYGSEYAAKAMNITMHSIDNNFQFIMKWDDKLMLYPISQTAIDLNPLLKDDQNPGYY